ERWVLDVLTCVGQGILLDHAGRRLLANAEQHLTRPEEMAERFRDLPRALAATRTIAERCAFTMDDLGYRFPEYPLPPGETPARFLSGLTYAGAPRRYAEPL